VKVREVIKRIEADGWAQVRQRGSHRQFKHPTKPGRVTAREEHRYEKSR
jgi:predicted RNA binding protein YcfA (HicA-like mRNA interferase family)